MWRCTSSSGNCRRELSGFLVFGLGTIVMVLTIWWLRRAYETEPPSRLTPRFSRQQLILLSLMTLALAVTEAVLLVVDGGAPRLVFVLAGGSLTLWLWWRAWHIR